MKFKSYQQFNEGIEDLFRSAHAAIDPEELIPLEDLIGQPKFPSYEEFDAAVDYLEINPEHLYYNPKDFISPIMYWDGPIYEPFHGGLNMEALKMMRVKDRLAYKIKETKKMLDSKNYSRLFSMMDKKILIPSFIKMYEELPDKDKYEIFKDLYVRSEYGFQSFPIEVISDCFAKRKLSPEWKKRIKEFETVAKKNPDGTVTLYRGENVDSAKSDDAFSWTLDKKTAKFFADRFSKGSGRIVEKKIDPKEVIDYLDDRGESEVILFPKKFGTLKESVEFSPEKKKSYVNITSPKMYPVRMIIKDENEIPVTVKTRHPNMGTITWFTLDKNAKIKIHTTSSELDIVKKLEEIFSNWTTFYATREGVDDRLIQGSETMKFLENVPAFGKWWKESTHRYRGALTGTKFGL